MGCATGRVLPGRDRQPVGVIGRRLLDGRLRLGPAGRPPKISLRATGSGRARRARLEPRLPGMKDSRYWSAEVTAKSAALDLEPGVFTWEDPRRIAASLKQSAERSERRKGTPFQSAMSMLSFYINRAGRNLSEERRQILERAKTELRRQFGRVGSTAPPDPERE
jgi:hypothetical protein